MTLLDALRSAVGEAHVLTDDDVKASYETDWTGRFSGTAMAVVRPAGTAEVSSVVAACAAAGTPIVVQGGNTGLVGGSVPAGGEVVLSLTRVIELGTVDVPAAQVTVGAGVTLAALQEHARAGGLDFGVDLAARDSATVGGLMATNAGGIRVLRYGSMRAQVVGAEAVLADGSVVSRLGGLEKDNTGYDLVSLLCGSEGTLGVITRLRLRLVPRLRSRAVALLALADTSAAVAILPALRERLPDLSAVELFLAPGLALVRNHAGLPAPFPVGHPAYLVVECAARTDPTDALVDAVAEVDGLLDATVATDAAGQRALWAYREQHTEAINAAGVPVKLDVSVPVGRLPELVERLPAVIDSTAPGARPVLFGHVNEGNLHVNVLDAGERGEQVSDGVLRLVAELGGSISSEHGVGRAKVPWLGLSRSATEVAAMRAIKNALDPAGTPQPRRPPARMTAVDQPRHRVVVIGSGFGGLFAAKALKRAPVDVTLIDRTAHHLFQPLLYQVATGILSEGEIAPATREVLRRQKNVRVLLGDVTDIDLASRTVVSQSPIGQLRTPYDSLVVAAGAGQSYFGNDQFAQFAPGMKTIDDALELRGRIFGAFEMAELATDLDEIDRWLTFVVVGAGPTGVEMAGQISELARRALRRNFRSIDPATTRVVLLDAAPEILGNFGDNLAGRAIRQLNHIKVDVQLGAKVVDMDDRGIEIEDTEGRRRRIESACKIWAAGVAASPLGARLAEQTGAGVDRAGRVQLQPDLTLPGHPEVFLVGDLLADQPGVAQVAIQGGRYAAKTIRARLANRSAPAPFVYKDKGSMATVSRFHAIASIGRFRFAGLIAWLMWLALHLFYLVGFKNRVTTLLHWAVSFVGRGRAERTATMQQVLARQALEQVAKVSGRRAAGRGG